MKKTLLISTFLVSILYHFQVNATELTDALRENKSLAEIQTLIKNGANVNQPDERSGLYPLMMAKNTEVFRELIKAGADIKARNEYTSVFLEVCAEGMLEMVQDMVKAGANVNEVFHAKFTSDTPLNAAIRNKDPKVVEFLIQSGADVKAKIPDPLGGYNLLETALFNDAKPEIIKTLIKHGVDIPQRDKYSGSFYEDVVSQSSYPELISVFQEAGLDFKKENLNLLFLNAIKNHKSLEMAKYLIQQGADPNVRAERILAGSSFNEDYPIIVAAESNSFDALKFLLEQNVNVNVKNNDGKTPLQILQENSYLIQDPDYSKYVVALGGKAISEDEVKRSQNSVKLLDRVVGYSTTIAEIKEIIQDGVNINYKDQYDRTALAAVLEYISDEKSYNEFKTEDSSENSLDYQSYVKKQFDIADLLLKNGADIHQKNKRGENLLFMAIKNDSPKVLEYLLKKGLDVNATDDMGNTPLMEAVSFTDNVEIIKMLLKYGADKTIRNNYGQTVAKRAQSNENPEIQKLLKMTSPKYNLPPSAEKYYSEMKEGILKGMVLPMVQNTVSDQTKIQSVVKKIEDSIDMDQVKSDSWPCLSKIPESKWNSAENCFTDFMIDLKQKTVMFTALANSGEDVDLNDKVATLSAIQKGAEVVGNKAMVKHYANSLMTDISIISIIAKAANGGEGKDVSSDEADDLKNKKIACGAKLYGKKDGSVVIEFPNECARMEKSDERFDISVDEVIEAAKKDEYSLYTLSCTGHKCIGKFKN